MPILREIIYYTIHLAFPTPPPETKDDGNGQCVQVCVEGGGGGRGIVKFHTFFGPANKLRSIPVPVMGLPPMYNFHRHSKLGVQPSASEMQCPWAAPSHLVPSDIEPFIVGICKRPRRCRTALKMLWQIHTHRRVSQICNSPRIQDLFIELGRLSVQQGSCWGRNSPSWTVSGLSWEVKPAN